MTDNSPHHQQAFTSATEAAAHPVTGEAVPAFQSLEEAEKTPVADIPLSAADLQAVMNVPVRLRAVLGRARMDLGRLLRLANGEVIELDRRAGEPVDIFINDRFAARGEVVLIDNVLGVTLTEIARQDR
jgi:flagellar motor switch protein FliN/FliY